MPTGKRLAVAVKGMMPKHETEPGWMEKKKTLTGKKLAVAINAVCCTAIFFFGYDQGMMSGVNQTPDYVQLMNVGTKVPPDDENSHYTVNVTNQARLGGIVAVYYLGTLFGGILAAWLSDRFGRINGVRVACAWVLVGAALQAAAQNMNWMICARVITGFGTGSLNAAIPVYSAETSHYNVRGTSIAVEFFLNIAGVAVAYWIEYGLSYVDKGDSSVRWRFPVAFQLVPLIVLAIAINFLPESPRWLLSKGKEEEALRVLRQLRDDELKAEAEFQDIQESVREDQEIDDSFWKMPIFPQGKLNINRRVQIVFWFQIFQEWAGIAAITVYQPTIFAQAGFDTDKSNWLSGLNNICYMLSTLIAVFTVDRIGRRKLSMIGSFAQAVAMFLIGAFSYKAKVTGNSSYGAASASFVFIYTAAFGASWLTTPWIYQNEIFPVQIRVKGAAWGVVGWSIGNGWLMLLSPVMFNAIAEKTVYIFGAVNIACIFLVYFFVPETARRTLEEIDWLFSPRSIWAKDAEKAFKDQTIAKGSHAKAVNVALKDPESMKQEPEAAYIEYAGSTKDSMEDDI